MAEVPACQHVHAGHGCGGNVLGIGAHTLAESAALAVSVREFPDFLRDGDHLHVVCAENHEHILNGLRRTFQLVNHNRRYDQRHPAPHATLDQPMRVFPGFLVLATTDHRGVGVDAKASAPGNPLEGKQTPEQTLSLPLDCCDVHSDLVQRPHRLRLVEVVVGADLVPELHAPGNILGVLPVWKHLAPLESLDAALL